MDTWNGCAMEGWLKAFPIVLSTGHIVDWSTQIIRQNGQLPMVCVREACLLYNGSYQQAKFRIPASGSLGGLGLDIGLGLSYIMARKH